MPNILDELSHTAAQFQPATVNQYTALQILRRFNGQSFCREYRKAAEHHFLIFLIDAYRRTAQSGGASPEFFQSLGNN
jgi:hypothetical protein